MVQIKVHLRMLVSMGHSFGCIKTLAFLFQKGLAVVDAHVNKDARADQNLRISLGSLAHQFFVYYWPPVFGEEVTYSLFSFTSQVV